MLIGYKQDTNKTDDPVDGTPLLSTLSLQTRVLRASRSSIRYRLSPEGKKTLQNLNKIVILQVSIQKYGIQV
jgi:hypothetical protein